MRVHQTGVPYPAELWADGGQIHGQGVAMFVIGVDGYLTAEYFAYDQPPYPDPWGDSLPSGQPTLLMKDLQLEIAIWRMRVNHKASTDYLKMRMPPIRTYECTINGWVGDPESETVKSASLTLSGLPTLHLPRSRSRIHETTRGEGQLRRRVDIETDALELECEGWRIKMSKGVPNWVQETPPVYLAFLEKQDGSVFQLSDAGIEKSIVDALFNFLSFQAGRWIGIPTIIGDPPDFEGPLAHRARLGKLTSENDNIHNTPTASDWREWPRQFNVFWNKYSDQDHHSYLQHAVHHYVDCSRIFDDGAFNYSVVAARYTLEALTRWWNGLREDFSFGRPPKDFSDHLFQAILKAELGLDEGKQIVRVDLSSVVKAATDYRNRIGHGRGGGPDIQTQQMIDYHLYYHNLARFLILAQLGNRDTDSRGYLTSPKFVRGKEQGKQPT